MTFPLTLEEFNRSYPTEEDCVRLFERLKWPEGFFCPLCGQRKASVIRSRRLPLYECRHCRYQASLTVGTVMEKSKTPLRKWFAAMLGIAAGISARQVAKSIKVTYKTAWLIGHKIRHAIQLAEAEIRLTGRVCIQEDRYRATSFSASFNPWRKAQPLMAAASLSENGQPLRIKLRQLPPSRTYSGPAAGVDFRDFAKMYLSEDCEPATVPGCCSSGRNRLLVQRCQEAFEWMNNTFRGLGPKHLQAYLDQFVYLFRQTADGGLLLIQDLLLQCARRPSLPYPALTRRLPTRRAPRPLRHADRHATQAVNS